MPIQGVAEDSFAIGTPEDMNAYFSLYAEMLLDVERLESTEAGFMLAESTT